MIMLFVLTNALKTLDHSVLILCLKHGVGNKGIPVERFRFYSCGSL